MYIASLIVPVRFLRFPQDKTTEIKKPPNKQKKEAMDSNNGIEEFQYGKFSFGEKEDGKISCPICKCEFARIMSHLNNSKDCGKSFCMEEIKKEFTKYKDRQSRKKYASN